MTATNQITKNLLLVLNSIGFYAWRQNNAAVYDAKFGGFRSNSAKKGISDVIGFHKHSGKFIACEIKTGKDKLSVHQTEFLNQVERSGGYSFVVKTIEDVQIIAKLFEKLKLTDSVNNLKNINL